MNQPMKVHCQVLNKKANHLPCLVLLHGWGFHRSAWPVPWLSALQQRFQVILVDLPGHGEANISAIKTVQGTDADIKKAIVQTSADKTSALALLADFIEALMAQLPVTFHLLGWSLGGQVALKIAAQFPNRVQSLVCLASNPHFTATDNHHGMAAEALQHFTQSYLDNPEKTLTRFCRLQSQGALQTTCRTQLQTQVAVVTGQVIGLYWLAQLDVRHELANISFRCLYVFAEADALVPLAVMQDVKALFNVNASNTTCLQSLPGCHALPFEYPDPSSSNPLWTLLASHWDSDDQPKYMPELQTEIKPEHKYKEGEHE